MGRKSGGILVYRAGVRTRRRAWKLDWLYGLLILVDHVGLHAFFHLELLFLRREIGPFARRLPEILDNLVGVHAFGR